ncbi:MAG: hypothetical protein R3B35_14035 [Gemmatimonadales bacterium]
MPLNYSTSGLEIQEAQPIDLDKENPLPFPRIDAKDMCVFSRSLSTLPNLPCIRPYRIEHGYEPILCSRGDNKASTVGHCKGGLIVEEDGIFFCTNHPDLPHDYFAIAAFLAFDEVLGAYHAKRRRCSRLLIGFFR